MSFHTIEMIDNFNPKTSNNPFAYFANNLLRFYKKNTEREKADYY